MRITVALLGILAGAFPALANSITAAVSNVTSNATATAGTCGQSGAYSASVNCSMGVSTLDAGADLLAGVAGVASGVSLYADSLPVNTFEPVVASSQASFQELFTLTGSTGGDYLFIPYTLQVDPGSDVFDSNFSLGLNSYELTASGSSAFKTFVTYGQKNTFSLSLDAATPSDPHHASVGHSGAVIIFGNPYLNADPNATSGQSLEGTLFPAPVPEPSTLSLLTMGILFWGICVQLIAICTPQKKWIYLLRSCGDPVNLEESPREK